MREIPSDGVEAMMRGRSILRNGYILPGTTRVPRRLAAGDFAVILDVGACCATRHMELMSIRPAAEVMLDAEGASHLIAVRGDDMDKWRHVLPDRRSL